MERARSCERVLVVNDDPDMVASMKDVLEVQGLAVRGAIGAQEVEEVLASGFEPSVILMDVRLGGGDRGDVMARRLRSDSRLARAPIVLMSGDARELQRLEPNADAVLLKPFDPEQLVERLEEVCRAGPKGKELG